MDDPLYFRAYDLMTARSCLRFDSMLMSLVILVLAVVTDFANATDDPNDLGGATFYGNAQGGSGGSLHRFRCFTGDRISLIKLRSGRRIDSFGIGCNSWGGSKLHAPKYEYRAGGSGGSISRLNVPEGYNLYRISGSIGRCGKSTERVCQLRFHMRPNPGLSGQTIRSGYYGRAGTTPLSCTAKARYHIIGFEVRAGREIDNLRCLYELMPPYIN